MKNRVHIDHLIWDDWNRDHITKHGVVPAEAGEVVSGEAMFRESYKQRLAVTGPTESGRMLTIVLGAVPNQAGDFYVFSARPSSWEERRDYQFMKEGEVE